jgi:hypothetical protein
MIVEIKEIFLGRDCFNNLPNSLETEPIKKNTTDIKYKSETQSAINFALY